MSKLAMKFVVLVLVVALASVTIDSVVIDYVAVAQELEESLTQHPDPALADYYLDHAADIEALRAQVMQGETAQRLQALEELANSYYDAAINTAIEMIDDSTPEIAVAAAQLLASSIAMANHPMDEDHQTPYEAYMHAQHTAARAALLDALEDPRAEVRAIAARVLASQSDEEALRKINAGVEQGLYSETEAVNYSGLADADVGAQYLEPYLETGSTEARIGAVTYFGNNPQYQDFIRDEVLLDVGVDPQVRGAAARTLSIYDLDYSSYGLVPTIDPNIPPSLYGDIMNAYISRLQADNALQPAANILWIGIDNYGRENLEADLESSRNILNQYPR